MHAAILNYSIISPVATWLQRSVFSSAKWRVLEGLGHRCHRYQNIFSQINTVIPLRLKDSGYFLTLHFRLRDLQCFPEATGADSQRMIPGCLCFKDRRSSYRHEVGPPNTSEGHFHHLVQILHRATVRCSRPCLTGDIAPEVQNKAHQHNI